MEVGGVRAPDACARTPDPPARVPRPLRPRAPCFAHAPSPPGALTGSSHRRTFLQAVSSEKVRATNLNCSVIADVRHDGSEPCVDVVFGRPGWDAGGRRRTPGP